MSIPGNKQLVGYIASPWLRGLFGLVLLLGVPFFVQAAEVLVDDSSTLGRYQAAPAMVFTSDQVGFTFYIGAEGDLEMASTTDGGATWSSGRTVDTVNTTDIVNYSIWWDGWTPTTTTPTIIHIATIDQGVDDNYYTPYNVVTNTFGTTTLVSTQDASCVVSNSGAACPTSITKATNGDLYIAAIDTTDRWVFQCLAGTDCTSTGNWVEVTPGDITGTEGSFLLSPMLGSANIFAAWRNSGTVIKWGEFSATSSIWHASGTVSGTFAASAESRYGSLSLARATTSATTTLAVIWAANDFVTEDHDIRFFEYSTTSGFVEKTEAVTNAAGALTSVGTVIDNSSTTAPVYYLFYKRRTVFSGAEFAATSTNLYYRTSADFGVTWSSEQGPVNDNTEDIAGPFLDFATNERIAAGYQYANAPRANDVYYELVADVTPWVATQVIISGTLYTDAGTTPAPAGVTIGVAIGTTTPSVHSTTTAAGGVWTFTGAAISADFITSTTPLVVWLDASSTDATTLVTGYSSTTITGIPLYYNYVVSHGSSSAVTVDLSAFTVYDRDQDSDILFVTATSASSTTIFADFINEQGTFKARTDNTVLTGSFTNNATFDDNNGTLRLAGTSESLSGTLSGVSDLGNVVVTGSYTTAASVASTSALVVRAGASFTAPATRLSNRGGLTNLGTFADNSGELVMEGLSSESLLLRSGLDGTGSATGTGAITMNTSLVIGNYLYAGKDGNTTACAQTIGSAVGCELMIFDISSTTNPTYVAGRDASGNSSGGGSAGVYTLVQNGNLLYVGKAASSTACSQTAGSADGCELMVFDISSTTNPVYLTGLDASGSSAGTGAEDVNSIIIFGQYLYIGKGTDTTACDQTAGAAIGCELMVFDISSTTNPVYRAGRDSDGSPTGILGPAINNMALAGSYIYVGKVIDATGCNQAIGSGDGCELMVFDISSTTNPTYVGGRDSSGTSNGTIGPSVNDVVVGDGVVYVGKASDVTACTQVSGSADGCELMVFDIASATNPVFVTGLDSAGNYTSTLGPAIDNLLVSGNSLYVGKGADGTACTQTAGSADGCELMVFDISSTTNPVYVLGVDSSGSADGTAGPVINDVMLASSTLYLAKGTDVSACTQTAGSADGCELMLLSVSALPAGGVLAGTLIGTSDVGTVVVKSGTARFFDNASTTNVSIGATATLTAPSYLSISGDYTNAGVAQFNTAGGEVTLTGATQSLAGNLTGVSALPHLTLAGSGTKTISDSASTSNLVISSGVTLNAPTTLTLAGNLTNSGTYNDGDLLELKAYVTDYLGGQDSTSGAGANAFNAIVATGTTLYVGKASNSGTCSSSDRTGCELMVFDISSTTNPVYVNGQEGAAVADATTATVNALALASSTLYVGKSGNSGTCSSSDRTGCELMVFDISSTTNPVYVNGQEGGDNVAMRALLVDGATLHGGKTGSITENCSATVRTTCTMVVFDISSTTNPVYINGQMTAAGTLAASSKTVNGFALVDDVLYVVKTGKAGTCSTTDRTGCELQVYDVSSSTDPVFVGGQDSSTGGGTVSFNALVRAGAMVYVGKTGTAGTCTAADRTGCELMVFDISSTTNPVFLNGQDSVDGTINGLAHTGNTLYVGKAGNAGTCSSSDRTGCELMVVGLSSSTNPTYIDGRDSTSGTGSDAFNTFMLSSTTLYVGKAGNAGTCSSSDRTGCELTVYDLASNLSGSLTGSSALGDVTVSGVVRFNAVASTTDLTIGSIGRLVAPARLTVAGNYTNSGIFTAGTGTTTLSGVAQQTATGTLAGTSAFRNLEVANTSGTGIGTQAVIFGAPLETTGTFTMRASTSAQFPGNATNTFAKVNWNGGAAVSPVYLRSTQTETQWRFSTQEFVTAAYINVRDSYHASTTAVPCTEGTCVNAGNNTNWGFAVENTGSLTLSAHPAGQAENQFSFQNQTYVPLFRFSLTAATETAIMDEVVITLTGIRQLEAANLQDLTLYVDQNGNGVTTNDGDPTVLGTGVLSITGETGTITFTTGTTSVATTTATNYIVTGSTYSINNNTYATFRLSTDDISAIGGTNYLPVTMLGSVDPIQHIRGNAGGSGINRSPIGGDGPAGAGQQGGGGQGGGGGAGDTDDGENIASDPNFQRPTTNGAPDNDWTNPANAYSSDGSYATAGTGGHRQAYGGFGFNIPGSNIIQGITVKVDASGSTAAGTIQIGLSWNQGANVTTLEATPTLSGSDIVYEVGGQSDLWGRSWTATELNDQNFRLHIIAQPNSNTVRVDALEVRVYHTAGGGGGGGGGEI